MIEVIKGEEPMGLKQLRQDPALIGLSPKEAYRRLRSPLKEEVVKCLNRDQGNLCVYCMSKIPRNDKDAGIAGITIEHYIPLEPLDGRDVGQGLDYNNLFAVCHGNTKMREKGKRNRRSQKDLTCDKHRENTEFKKIDPCNKDTLKTIFYTTDGKIDASDPDVRYDLLETLNLNCPTAPLIEERRAALDGLIADFQMVNVEDRNELHNYCCDRLESFLNEGETKTPYVLQTTIESLS